MIPRHILSKLLEIEDLPTLPDIMTNILDTVEDESSSAEDLTSILETDHAISARVLRLSNSAFYGLRYEVETIRRAIVVVGFEAVRELALATSVFDMFAKHKQFAFDAEDFWLHSLGAAKASQQISKAHFPDVSAGACFTGGLLHDIGKYLLALVLKGEYRDYVELARVTNRPLVDIEDEYIHTTHSAVGYWIADKWNFPKMIAEVIQKLYNVESVIGQFKTEIAIVSLADEMSRVAGFGLAGDPEPVERASWGTEGVLNLSREQVDEHVETLKEQRADARQFLNILGESE